MFSVEVVNKLVQNRVPFRDAYKFIGKQIANNYFNPEKSVNHTHEGSINNLCLDNIVEKMKNALKQ